MVNWKLAKEDPYYSGRELEERARTKRSAETWQEFAELKAKKGSYTLAVHGYLSSALICEQEKRLEKALDLLAKAFENARVVAAYQLGEVDLAAGSVREGHDEQSVIYRPHGDDVPRHAAAQSNGRIRFGA